MAARLLPLAVLGVAMLGSGCASPSGEGQPIGPLPSVQTPQATPVDLDERIAGQPTVLVFYRGQWCSYCMKQLAAIESVHDELAGLGYQVIALSPDKPDIAGRTRRQEGLSFPVWSDQDVAVADALGLSLEVSDARYRALRDEYDIDLEAYSGRSHHKFPQSAIYLLDGTGTVRWRHASKDASKVVPARRILAAAREASGPESAP